MLSSKQKTKRVRFDPLILQNYETNVIGTINTCSTYALDNLTGQTVTSGSISFKTRSRQCPAPTLEVEQVTSQQLLNVTSRCQVGGATVIPLPLSLPIPTRSRYETHWRRFAPVLGSTWHFSVLRSMSSMHAYSIAVAVRANTAKPNTSTAEYALASNGGTSWKKSERIHSLQGTAVLRLGHGCVSLDGYEPPHQISTKYFSRCRSLQCHSKLPYTSINKAQCYLRWRGKNAGLALSAALYTICFLDTLRHQLHASIKA